MAKNTSTFAPRRKRGFERASGLVQGRVRKAGESRGFAVTRLLTHWSEIVGEDMAATTRPIDIKYGRQGLGATLTVLTSSAHAPMLQMQEPKLREKVNACYGYTAISRIRITQTAPTGFAEGKVQFKHAPKRTKAPIDPVTQQEARNMSASVGDDGLRKALELLAGNVLSKSKNNNP